MAVIAVDAFPRFWAQVDMTGGLLACWPWTGATSLKRSGTRRGAFQIAGRGSPVVLVHRWALCLAGGGLEEYQQRTEHAAHRCSNRLCCNTYSHLYWATDEQNRRDRVVHEAGQRIPLEYRQWCRCCTHTWIGTRTPRCSACGTPAPTSLHTLESAHVYPTQRAAGSPVALLDGGVPRAGADARPRLDA